MMNNLKFIDKLLSIILVTVILANIVSVTALADSEQKTELFVFKVYDSENSPISSADISYKVLSEKSEISSGNLKTDDNGTAVISDKNLNNERSLNISYVVSKEGYENKEGTVSVDDERLVINLEKNKNSESDTDKVKITLNKHGESGGIIEVNGSTITIDGDSEELTFDKSSKISIKFSTNNNPSLYIESISKIDGNNIKNDIKIEDENTYKDEFTAESDITYNVTFGKKYALKIGSNIEETNSNCKIVLNGINVTDNNYTGYYKSNETIDLTISAKDKVIDDNDKNNIDSYGYQISSISVGDRNKKIPNKNEYNVKFKIDSDKDINITFSKTYVITLINYFTNQGEIEVTVNESNTKEGTIIIESGEQADIKVTPNNDYIIKSVTYNGIADEDCKSGSDNYSKSFKVDKNYTIAVTFAPKQYSININEYKNGTVEIPKLVQYGKHYNIKIKPDNNYTLSSIKINGEDYKGEFTYNNDEYVTLEVGGVTEDQEIDGVTEDQEITVEFKEAEEISENISKYISITNENCVWNFNNKYIFRKDGKMTIKSIYNKIHIYGSDISGEIDQEISKDEEFTITKNTTINTIQVYCQSEENELIMAWHNISCTPLNISFVESNKRIGIAIKPSESSGVSNSGENIYNSDVTVDISVKDEEISSGIKSINYKIEVDGKEEDGVLYSFDYTKDEAENSNSGVLTITDWDSAEQKQKDPEVYKGAYPTEEQLRKEWNGKFIINSEAYNADNVVLTVTVTDNAGNESEKTSTFNINTDTPEFNMEFDNEAKANKVVDDRGYYNESRKAKITITDRASSFDKDVAEESIKAIIFVFDGEQANYSLQWENEPNDSDNHTVNIEFDGDANYTIDESKFKYENKAANTTNSISFIGSNTNKFTIDKTAPTASVTVDSNVWDKLLSTITFGLFGNKEVTVKINYSDKTSPCTATYYISDESNNKTIEKQPDEIFSENNNIVNIDSDNNFIVPLNSQFVIYVKTVDYAGNVQYISSDGFILENNLSDDDIQLVIETAPSGASNSGENIYNSDVKVDISVTDKEISSGIKSINYKIEVDGKEKEDGVLYSFDYTRDEAENSNSGVLTITDWDSAEQKQKDPEVYKGAYPTEEQLRKEWNGKFIINSKAYSADNVVLTVTVTDNAGNKSEKTSIFNINTDTPEFNMEFDNEAKANKVVDDRGYYNESRKAKITITDRASSFDKDVAEESIKAIIFVFDGEQANYSLQWENEPNNSDNHTVNIEFDGDANYTIDKSNFEYKNKAANTANSKSFSDSNTNKFTIDKTTPTANVTVGSNVWNKILSTITFGLFGNEEVDVVINGNDSTSPIVIEYYKTNKPIDGNNDTEIKNNLDNIYKENKFKTYNGLTVLPDEQFIIYARVTDYAGNYIYLNTDGYIIDSIPSAIKFSIDTTPSGQAHNKVNVYNSDVTIDINVNDNLSGIKSISYQVKSDSNETQSGDLYKFDYKRDEAENSNSGVLTITDWDSDKQKQKDPEIYEGAYPIEKQLKKEWNGKLKIYKNLNNSCDVQVVVKIEDNAGNESEGILKLDIDCTEPNVDIKFSDKGNKGAFDGYYTERTAKITVTERTTHFNGSEGIKISAKDINSKSIENAYTISKWTTSENSSDSNKAKHTAVIKFIKDANYSFEYDCVDKANNKFQNVKTYKFTVDKTAPTGTLTAISAEGRKETWDNGDLNKNLTFGFWSNKKISISGTSNDKTSPIASVEYYKVSSKNASDGTNNLSIRELDKITSWKKFSKIDIKANEQFVIYVKITDRAGNYSYVKTNGLIVDDQRPIEEIIAPEITITPPWIVNDIYNSDVKVAISVKDPLTGGTYSGLKNISYKVFNNSISTTEPTQEGVLYSFSKSDPKQSELVQKINKSITVDSSKNNSNNVEIVVYAEDNAGNSSHDDIIIKIDTTNPKIDISYDNNNVDSKTFFRQNRTALISITERNFNSKDVKLNIKSSNGNIPTLSPWKKKTGTGNLDNTVWTANLVYSKDDDYEFSISYSDDAGNKCTGERYASETVAERKFTIDKTVPVISVSYNNNSVKNNIYYKSDRTATITIKEHNFDKSRVNMIISASEADNGKNLESPKISEWINSGNDTYTAKVSYSFDAKFIFDIDVKDKAGNKSADFEKQTFIVDKTAPQLKILGVKDKSANNGDVIPIIKYSDVNFDENKVEIQLDGSENKNIKFEGIYTNKNSNGQTFEFNNFEKKKEIDDVYTLSVSLTDKAGNSTSKKIEFSVNRFGSTYKLGEKTKNLNNSYIQQPVDIEISEINVNSLKNITVTVFKNNEAITLKNNEDYKINISGGNGLWYCYNYIIFAKNFSDDGIYRISIHSNDEAGNIAENTLDTKNVNISFGVDKTKPNIIINNIESGVTYAVDNVTVKISPEDNLLLNDIKVYLDDYSKPYKSWTLSEIKDITTKNGEFTFDISGDSISSHNIKIVCTDASGNEQIKEITNVFVTTNFFVRYYNNKLLFFGSICVLFIIVISIIVLISIRKKHMKN